LDGLKEKSFPQIYADSTFYIWAKIPKNSGSSFDFAQTLLDRGVVATPGIGFGETGEGFVRFALTVDKTTLAKALKKI
jgi:LL-diaminopimelate aminotransferase